MLQNENIFAKVCVDEVGVPVRPGQLLSGLASGPGTFLDKYHPEMNFRCAEETAITLSYPNARYPIVDFTTQRRSTVVLEGKLRSLHPPLLIVAAVH